MIARPETSRFRWVIVLLLCAVAFVLYIDRVNISVAAPRMQEEFGFSDAMCGYVLGAFLIGYGAGLVPGGWMADRFGARRVLMMAGVSWAALTLAVSALPRGPIAGRLNPVFMLIAARFLLGICEACAFPTFARTLANWMRRGERAQASGLIHCGATLGGAFTPVFIAFVIAHSGWRQAFLMSGVITAVVTLVWWLSVTDHPLQHRRVSERELELIAAGREELRGDPPDRPWLMRLVRSRSAWMLCVSEVFYGLAGFVFGTWFYLYFVRVRGVGSMTAAWLYSLPFLAMAICAPLGGLLCDLATRRWGSRWGRRIIPLVSITLGGCCGIAAPIVRHNVLSAIVFAAAAGLMFTAAAAFWSTVIDVTRRGAGILGGLMNGSGQVGSALGTLTFAWLKDHLGWELALALGGLMGVVSGLTWLLIDASCPIDERQDRTQEPAL
jgi:MFS transporter, ACS family, glucarate transporter